MNSAGSGPGYPTSTISRGLVLTAGGRELMEEGLGFGVPLLKFGSLTVFPGSRSVEDYCPGGRPSLTVRFVLDLVETTLIGDRPAGRRLQTLRAGFSSLHRKCPRLRPVIGQASRYVKHALGMSSRFERRSPVGEVVVSYVFDTGQSRVRVHANLDGLATGDLTEIILANEQGGNCFDRYRDSSGLDLCRQAIGSWDECTAAHASFSSARDNVSFTLYSVPSARMFRGREVEPGRLAWAGLNYVLPPQAAAFAYDIAIKTSQAVGSR